jgi:hypothetical protein
MYIVPVVDPGGCVEALGIINAVASLSKFKLVGEKVARLTLAVFKANTPLPSIWNLKVEAPAIEALILAIPVANVKLPEFGIILTVLAIYYKYLIMLR